MQSQHVNPKESVQIHADVGAKRSIGVHWGTFALTDEPLDEAPKALARERLARSLADDAFFTLAIGQTLRLPPRR
jgi:N-acyl-phosphatidylethanolamine-hydrolysing phospholipase D